MTTQTEAERLAELLEQIDGQHWQVQDSAAAELRRLVSFNQQLMDEVARLNKAVADEREACAKVCEAQAAVYLKDGERWLRGSEGKPDTRLKELAPHLEAAWEAEQLLKNGSGAEWITQAHKCAAAIRARENT